MVEFYPPRIWGLDPLFSTRVKLNIGDVLTLAEYPGHYRGVYCLLNHPIVNVCIMGDLVMVDIRSKFIIYEVDDGTGIIRCSWWRGQSDCDDESQPPVSLGNLVTVYGRVSVYRNQREIMISTIKAEADPNNETLHWLEIANLKTLAYSKPFILPPQLRNITNCESVDAKSMLQRCLLGYLSERSGQAFSLEELRNDENLVAHLKRKMFELSLTPDNTMEMIGDVIQSLTPMGHVVPLGTRGRDGTIQYQLCTDENHLFPAVLQALRAHNDCPLSEYEIIQHVKCHKQMLKSVPDKRIRRAIQELVESSRIYPMGGHLYHAV